MQPLKPTERQSILENSPSAQPGDVEEYDRLLAARFTTDPDFHPAAAPQREAFAAGVDHASSEARIAELHEKLYSAAPAEKRVAPRRKRSLATAAG